MDLGRAFLCFPFYIGIRKIFHGSDPSSNKTRRSTNDNARSTSRLRGRKNKYSRLYPRGNYVAAKYSGARNAEEAVRIARLAREAGCGDFVKIEVIHDSKYLLPDNYEIDPGQQKFWQKKDL